MQHFNSSEEIKKAHPTLTVKCYVKVKMLNGKNKKLYVISNSANYYKVIMLTLASTVVQHQRSSCDQNVPFF